MSAIVKTDGPVALTPGSFEDAKTFAKVLAQARGFVPRDYIGQPAAILAAIVMGSEIGIGPMQALRSIHVIEGKPQLSADLMLALAIRAGVRVEWLQCDTQAARCKLTREGFPDHEQSFTWEEAERAGLTGPSRSGKPSNWMKYPAAMLRARCISHGLRAWSPDVLGAGVYAEGELEEAIAPQPAPIAAVEPESQASGEPAPAEDVVDAEAACMAEQPSDQPALRGTDERKLADLNTPDDLKAWLASGWDGTAIQAGPRGIEKVLRRADELGAPHGEVRDWMGIREEATE